MKNKKNVKTVKTVKIEKPISSPGSKYDFDFEKGAISQLHLITEPLAEFLKLEYVKDTDCLSGDIIKLFELTKVDFEQNSKREFEN